MTAILILAGVVLLILMVYISNYNSIKRNRNQIENAKSSLDALFIKRNELIPNLVAVLEQYTQYEKGILEQITALRQSVNNNPKDYQKDDDTDRILKKINGTG